MRRFLTASASVVALVIPATADAKPVKRRHVTEYERAYSHAKHVFGRRAVGCRLLKTCRGRVSDARMVASTRVLHRMFAPPPVTVTATVAPAVQATVSAVSPGSLPACTWAPESGGNPTAVNPQTGAGGYYQIVPSTWAAYGGTGLPQDAPMSEQTAVAQRVMAGQGPSAWVNCG